MGIPTLDMAMWEKDRERFVQELGAGYSEWGFCGLVNHGVSDQLIATAYDVMKAFFALDTEIKEKYHVPGIAGARGYTGFGVEIAKGAKHVDLKEFWQFGRVLPKDHPARANMPDNVWAEEVALFREHAMALYEALDDLGKRVLKAMALYLGQDESYFDHATNYGNSILRAIHYPPIKEKDTPSVRAAEHEDINLITLLVGSNEPGLEVLSKKGEWIPVTTIEGTIVCNIGDMLQRLTNHVLPSTTHRVVNPPGAMADQSRYSIPFFLHPNPDFEIKTLASCITAQRPNRYPEPITALDYLDERLAEIGLKGY